MYIYIYIHICFAYIYIYIVAYLFVIEFLVQSFIDLFIFTFSVRCVFGVCVHLFHACEPILTVGVGDDGQHKSMFTRRSRDLQ